MLLNLDENKDINSKDNKVTPILPLNDKTLKNKPRKKTVTNIDDTIENDLKNILMYATLINHPVWKIEQDEIDLIIKPLSNILKRMGLNKKNSEYMDYISLLTGLSIIILPRVIMQLQLVKDQQSGFDKGKEKNKNEGQNIIDNEGDNKNITTITKEYDKNLYPNI
jgi:hypothetical protein